MKVFCEVMEKYNLPKIRQSLSWANNAELLFDRLCREYSLPGIKSSTGLRRVLGGPWASVSYYLVDEGMPLSVSYLYRSSQLEVVTDMLTEEQVRAVL